MPFAVDCWNLRTRDCLKDPPKQQTELIRQKSTATRASGGIYPAFAVSTPHPLFLLFYARRCSRRCRPRQVRRRRLRPSAAPASDFEFADRCRPKPGRIFPALPCRRPPRNKAHTPTTVQMAPARAKKEPASPTPPSDDPASKDGSENGNKIKRKSVARHFPVRFRPLSLSPSPASCSPHSSSPHFLRHFVLICFRFSRCAVRTHVLAFCSHVEQPS